MADIEVTTTPPDLFRRLQRYPTKLDAVMRKTNEAALLHVQEKVPAYPAAPAGVDASRRTGTLGRSLGSSQSGGKVGQPTIHQIERLGTGSYEGRVGTSLYYAGRVIGEGEQQRPWSAYWWNMATVAKRAATGVVRLYDAATETLAAWIDGLGN